MRKTILAMTVLAAFACTAQTSNPTSPTTPPDQTQSAPTTTTPNTSPTPDMQQTPQTTPTPDTQQQMPSTATPEPQQSSPSAMPQSDQPPAATPAPAESSASQASSAAGQSYEGCVKEKHGKYMLMTNDGQKYMLHSSEDLSAHKGHEVKVTGELGVNGASSAVAATANRVRDNVQTLNVTNLDMVSTTCNMKKGGMDKDNGMSNPK